MRSVIFLIALALPSSAEALVYQPLVDLPFIGVGNATIDSYLLGAFQFLIGLSGVLAVVRMVWCGFKAIMSPSPSSRQESSQCVWGAITGLLLALSAWVILYEVNPILIGSSANIPLISSGAPGGGGLPGGGLPGGGLPGGGLPGGGLPGGGLPGGGLPGGGLPGGGLPGGGAPPIQCDNRNLCEAEQNFQCGNAMCDQYIPMALQHETARVPLGTLMSIMFLESSCNIGARNVAIENGVPVEHCGLMQISPALANQYLNTCRRTVPGYCRIVNGVEQCDPNFRLTCGMLQQPFYADASICIAAAYLGSLSQNQFCSENSRFTLAAYNGGPGVCQTSADCANERGCSGHLTRVWECPYDDPLHTVCNAGPGSYEETRDYVRRASACVDQFFRFYYQPPGGVPIGGPQWQSGF